MSKRTYAHVLVLPIRRLMRPAAYDDFVIDPEIYSILIFLEKDLGIVSPPYFGYDFSRKMFLILYYIN